MSQRQDILISALRQLLDATWQRDELTAIIKTVTEPSASPIADTGRIVSVLNEIRDAIEAIIPSTLRHRFDAESKRLGATFIKRFKDETHVPVLSLWEDYLIAIFDFYARWRLTVPLESTLAVSDYENALIHLRKTLVGVCGAVGVDHEHLGVGLDAQCLNWAAEATEKYGDWKSTQRGSIDAAVNLGVDPEADTNDVEVDTEVDAHSEPELIPADPIAVERTRLLAQYKADGKRAKVAITDRMVAEAANPKWHDRTQVKRWKANDPRISPREDRLIRQVLKNRPHIKKHVE
jgi:hypothetical protein